MSISSLKFGGSFTEELSSTTSPSYNVNYPPGVALHPIYFSAAIDDLFSTKQGHLSTSWREYFDQDYIYGATLKIVSLGAFYEIPSKQLAKPVSIDIDDSDGVKLDKLLANYFQYQKVGLRLWVRLNTLHRGQVGGTGEYQWFPCGETILQNKGIQIKLNLLPQLGVQTLGYFGGVGFEVVDKGNGRLSGTDYITVFGEYEIEITAIPKVIGTINLVETLQQNAN